MDFRIDLDPARHVLRNQLAEQAAKQARKSSSLAIENAELRETVRQLVSLLAAKGILSDEETAALLAQIASPEQALEEGLHFEPEPEPEADVSADLEALADSVDDITPSQPPIGEQ